jgi:hypothetical protein
MKPPRFTLRRLLLVVTLAAIGMWFLRNSLLPLPISKSLTTKVVIGDSQSKVRKLLGSPHDVYSTHPPVTWRYSVFGSIDSLFIEFDESGRVTSTERLFYVLRNPDE